MLLVIGNAFLENLSVIDMIFVIFFIPYLLRVCFNFRYLEAIRSLMKKGERLLRTIHVLFTPGLC